MLKKTLLSVIGASFMCMLAFSPVQAQMKYAADKHMDSDSKREYVAEAKSLSIKIEESEELSTFSNAIELANLKNKLSKGEYTIFVPSNAAFAKLPQAQQNIFDNSSAYLSRVVKYHIVEGIVKSEDLKDGQFLRTLEGQYLRVSRKGDTILVNGAPLVSTDQTATNGILHTMDNVAALVMP